MTNSYIVNAAGHAYIAGWLAEHLLGDYSASDLARQPYALACAARAEADACGHGGGFEIRAWDSISGRPEVCWVDAEHMDRCEFED